MRPHPCSSLALALVCSSSLWSQKPAAAPADPYAGEPLVIERSDLLYSFRADGTGFRERHERIHLQSEAALRELSVVVVPFAGASEKVEFQYVRVQHPDGSVIETPVSGVMEQPEEVTRQAPFYSDLKQAQLPVKSLRSGDTLEWDVRVVRTRAEAVGHFWGQETLLSEGVAVKEQSVELRVPEGSGATVWTNPTLGLKATESTADGQHIYRWQNALLQPTTGTEAEAAKKAKKSHILSAAEELDAEQGPLPSMAWTNYRSWEDVGAWYRTVQGSRNQPDDEVKARALALTANMKTPEDKLRALYAFVSTQVHYVGVAFGVGRYQPHEAADVLHNQYGDCKDKQTLLAAMLNAVGIPSDAALIGAGVRFNPDVPSPGAFNHLITHVSLGGADVWLDPTEEVAPYRMMVATLRDRQALVIPPTGAAHLATTPKDPPFASSESWVAKGKLDEKGVLESHIVTSFRGDDELVLRMVTRQIPPAKYDEYVQKLIGSFGYAGTSSHPDLSQPEDTTAPFVMAFDYHREQAGDWEHLRILPQLQPDGMPAVDDKEPPVRAIDLGWPRTMTSHSEMELPKGWTVELPEAVHEKTHWGSYDRTYRFENGVLTTDRTLVVSERFVPAAEWKAYKKWADATDLNAADYVQLRKPGSPAPASHSASSRDTARLQELLEQVKTAYERKDVGQMSSLLKEIKKIDPKARYYNVWAGMLAWKNGKRNEAIADTRKELELYPDELNCYATILWYQERGQDTAGEEETLRQWAKADPQNAAPLLQLTAFLTKQGRAQDALAAAEQAAARARDNSTLDESARMELGKAQLAAGKQADAIKTLTDLLNTSEDPRILNNCAYELLEAKLELPVAAKAMRKAVDKLTSDTKSWTLDETPAIVAAKTSLLLSAWDSMGWMLYREGKPQEAEPYLLAARLNRPSDKIVTDHLAEVRKALAEKGAAAQAYPDAGRTEQQMRTFPLADSGIRGTAEYRLLLAHNQVERAEPTGAEQIAGAEAMLKKADLAHYFPAGSEAKLVRKGLVNCVNGKCELVLEP